MMLFDDSGNPLNKLIWNKVEEMFYWNISVESPINQLPFTMEFILTCQKEFSMTVRDKEYPIHLGGIMDWKDKTMGDFVREIDRQYQSNYFHFSKIRTQILELPGYKKGIWSVGEMRFLGDQIITSQQEFTCIDIHFLTLERFGGKKIVHVVTHARADGHRLTG